MKLEITDTTLLKDIQEEFNKIYPFLWIDFFYPANLIHNHEKSEKIKPEIMVKEICMLRSNKIIHIERTKSVSQLEKDFWDALHLKIKVLRRSGNVWVNTSYTDNWTLENQNFEGQEIILD